MHFTQTAHRGIVTLAGLVALVGALSGTPARADHEHLTVSNIGSSGDHSTPDKDAQQVRPRKPTGGGPAVRRAPGAGQAQPIGFRAESTGHTAGTETCKGGPVTCRAFINSCLAAKGGVWTDDGKPIPQEWHCTTP